MKKLFPYILVSVLVAIDQVTKWWVLKHPLFVAINTGIVFGYGSNWDLFLTFSIILILALILISIKKTSNLYPFSLMLAGALSNLIDRIFRDGVVDYFKITFLQFNFADIMIFVGVIIYGWQVLSEAKN